MKIKGPGSPLSGGSEPLEPLDPRDLQQAIKSERFANALSQIEAQAGGATGEAASAAHAALSEIARGADLSTNEGALAAVRQSARFMIASRLSEKYRDSTQGEELVENLSEYVAGDPLLKSKLTSILRRLKNN